MQRKRTKAEVAATFRFSLECPDWLWWNLQNERFQCIDTDDTDSLWYDLVCRAIGALDQHDWAEVERLVAYMEETQEQNTEID